MHGSGIRDDGVGCGPGRFPHRLLAPACPPHAAGPSGALVHSSREARRRDGCGCISVTPRGHHSRVRWSALHAPPCLYTVKELRLRNIDASARDRCDARMRSMRLAHEGGRRAAIARGGMWRNALRHLGSGEVRTGEPRASAGGFRIETCTCCGRMTRHAVVFTACADRVSSRKRHEMARRPGVESVTLPCVPTHALHGSLH